MRLNFSKGGILVFLLLWIGCSYHERDVGNRPGSQKAPLEPAPTPPASNKGSTPDDPGSVSSNLDSLKQTLLQKINQTRRREGVEDLLPESRLEFIARQHSQDMVARDFFDHFNPEGFSSSDRIGRYHRQLVGRTGENLWMGTGRNRQSAEEIAEKVIQDWMASPGHRANLMDPEFTHLGVGLAEAENQVMVTVKFAEVRAYIQEPVPFRMSQGESFSLPVVSYLQGRPSALLYDFLRVSSKAAAGQPQSISNDRARAPAQSGRYRLRLFFPVSGEYIIYQGPEVWVE